uniref:Uncharacterized protein n=1 Tax=Arundo donax TaxID=35708 RepID=A0A0A9DVX2_ARUDO
MKSLGSEQVPSSTHPVSNDKKDLYQAQWINCTNGNFFILPPFFYV